jgi:hypothetical protein
MDSTTGPTLIVPKRRHASAGAVHAIDYASLRQRLADNLDRAER